MSIYAIALAGAALTNGAPPLTATGRWTVNFAEKMCLAERHYGDPDKPTILAMRPASLARTIEVRISEIDPTYVSRTDAGVVTLQPSGRAFKVKIASFGPVTEGRRISSFVLEDIEMSDLALAKTITVDRGHAGAPVAIAPSGSDELIASVTRCEDDLLRRWGVDPVAMRRLSRQPEPVGEGVKAWFKPHDYPKTARNNFRGGRTLALVTIGADGRVAGCNIAESAGNPDLDSKTCAILTERGRYAPGLDQAGKPVSSQKLVGVRWAMGGLFLFR